MNVIPTMAIVIDQDNLIGVLILLIRVRFDLVGPSYVPT